MKKYFRSNILLICLVVTAYLPPFVCLAQWSSGSYSNTIVCVEDGGQGSPIITTDGGGGAIIAWSDDRNGYSDVYAQRFSADGVVQWTANGISICSATSYQYLQTIISDGAGGAIMAWADFRNVDFQSNDPVVVIDIFAQRVNGSGVMQWPVNGVSISRPVGDLTNLGMVSDNNGGAIISWTDGRHNIFTQGINANGTLKWPETAITSDVEIQSEPSIISDGSGGAIIAWTDSKNASDQISAKDIYAQRINASGAVLWGTGGIGICNAPRFQNNSRLTADGSGGAIITWLDDREVTVNTGNVDVFAQHINANGVVQWAANGIGVCTTSDIQLRPTITTDQAGGAVIAWQTWTGFLSKIAVQRISSSGTKLWATDGVPIGSGEKEVPMIASDGNGGVILAWEDRRSSARNIYAQHLDANGVELWQPFGGIVVSNAYGEQYVPQFVLDNNGGVIMTWADGRDLPSNVYAQHIMPDGKLGGANILGNQTITFNSIPSKKFSEVPFTLGAIASSSLPVTYTSSNLSIATIDGNIVTIIGVGTSTITADQAGNANFSAAPPISQQLTVAKGDQTITFNALPVKVPGDTPFTLTANTSSDLVVSYASSNAAVATVSGNVVTIVGTGITNITASQPGNSNYNAATDVIQPFIVKTAQSISFSAIQDKTLGDGVFTVSATSSAALPVVFSSSSDKITISGSQVSIVKAGSVTINANQPGNATFASALPKTETFCINPAKPLVTVLGSGTDSPILTSSSASGNQWFRNGVAIPQATSNTLSIIDEGIFTVVVSADNCVSVSSDEKVFTITGIEERNGSINVYPNPMENDLIIDVTALRSATPVTMMMFDILGHKVFTGLNDGVVSVDVTTYPAGFYLLKIQQGKQIITKKLFK